MGFILLLIMIAVPIGEIAVFIEAGDRFGLWPTLAAVILTAIIGTAFLRHQGLGVLRRIQERMASGEAPVRDMFDGLCLLIAGALLLTPGFITDTVGFALLITPLRSAMAKLIVAHLTQSARTTVWSSSTHSNRKAGGGPEGRDSTIIDGEFEDISSSGHVEKEKSDEDDDHDPNRRIAP